MVVVFAWTMCAICGRSIFANSVRAQNHIGLQRLKRVDDYGQFFVFDLNRLDPIGGCITIFGDDKGDFLLFEDAVGNSQPLTVLNLKKILQS